MAATTGPSFPAICATSPTPMEFGLWAITGPMGKMWPLKLASPTTYSTRAPMGSCGMRKANGKAITPGLGPTDQPKRGSFARRSVPIGRPNFWTTAIKPLAPVNHVYGPDAPPAASTIPDKDVLEFLDYLAADPNPPTPGG